MTITGNFTPAAASRRCNSMPSTPGMRTSVTMHPSWTSGRTSRKAVAESCTRTANPTVLSRKASDWRTSASSSITWTMLLPAKLSLLRLAARHAQGEAEHRAAVGPFAHPDLAAMRFDDGSADRQPQPHALLLGCNEGLEKMSPDLRRETGPRIRDTDLYGIADKLRLDGNLSLSRRIHQDFDGVADQVYQDLLDLDAVGHDLLGARIEPERNGDRVL